MVTTFFSRREAIQGFEGYMVVVDDNDFILLQYVWDKRMQIKIQPGSWSGTWDAVHIVV